MRSSSKNSLFGLFALSFIAFSCTRQQNVPMPNNQKSQESQDLTISPLPKPDHIIVVVMENHGYTQIMGSSSAPYINSLAQDAYSANFSNSYALTHPSQPNYLMLYSGSNQGVTNDDNSPNDPFTTANLGKQLLKAGRTYKTYSESLPSVGYNGDSYGTYRRKHNPAANWMGSGSNQIPKSTNQPYTAFPTDYTKLPTVSFVIPNQSNDMHDGSISTGDTWLKSNLDKYIQWAKTHNSLFIVTFDEDNDQQGNHIVTIFCGSMIKNGTYTSKITHYNVLRTIENMYGLHYAGGAASATTINYCWK